MKDYIKSLLEKNTRIDGRKFNEFRKPLNVELNVSKNAEGSAKAIIGDTEVMVGVKLGVGEPFADSPDEGILIVNTELSPLSSPEFTLGPPGSQAIEISRIVDRGIRESKMIDMKKLCIKKGELVWMVFLDIYPINDSGNLIDTAALAAVAAIKSAVFPKLKDDKVEFGTLTKNKIPLLKTPITCTLFKINNSILIDPNTEEENVYEARLSVGVGEDNNIHAMQKGGSGDLSIEDVDKMVDMAIEKNKDLRKLLK